MESKGKIGIITGAGPEAGIDLWQKILSHTKKYYNEAYKGDIDTPYVVVYSVPELGKVMSIETNTDEVWSHLKAALLKIDSEVDYFCIACNVLHHYSLQIQEMNLKSKFVSIVNVTRDYLLESNTKEIALLSIPKVIELGKFSPYKYLQDDFSVETPGSEEMDTLIRGIKIKGSENKELLNDFRLILDKIEAKVVILACTELPLLSTESINKVFVDPTDILAKVICMCAINHSQYAIVE
ncbi:aspartate/glutamate racemase family protein [Aquimarina sp. RZ0]|uniref:aspartate/glutamate racemase family protein n=1 Tax=Aquimarina sp. RZ0 TaxID=2607730 RepID=UPI0011F0D2C4|nr:aspartate/glutamate racemase family protein [Aquimarina sp. RZ0]KAA1243935.1 aspartate/glutamate racemase family protein [Aquimarina sp. RZ0]